MLPPLTLECLFPTHLDRFGCTRLWWRTDAFWAAAILFAGGRLHDPVMWIGDTCWPITPGADQGELLGPPWVSQRRLLPAGA